jgi:hypothetical protein
MYRRVWDNQQLICGYLADLLSSVYKAAVLLQKRMARKGLIEIKNILPERRQWNMLTILTDPTTSKNIVLSD